jgi:hypothetical protein
MGKEDVEEKVVKIIKFYEDLKSSKPGEFILIKGRLELVINPNREYLKRFNYSLDDMYTLSVEGNFLVQNHYDNYSGNDKSHLEPFMKTSCRKDSDIPLGAELRKVATLGGLIL